MKTFSKINYLTRKLLNNCIVTQKFFTSLPQFCTYETKKMRNNFQFSLSEKS